MALLSPAAQVLEAAVEAWRRVVVRPLAALVPLWIHPNHLSSLRFLFAAVLAVFLWRGQYALAAAVYALALLTDVLDGETARLRNQESRLGAFLDPAADKALHGTLFLFFWAESPLLLGLLLLTDVLIFLVGVALLFRRTRPIELSASVFGRWKMLFQALGCSVLLWNSVGSAPLPSSSTDALFAIALLFTGISIMGYLPRVFPR